MRASILAGLVATALFGFNLGCSGGETGATTSGSGGSGGAGGAGVAGGDGGLAGSPYTGMKLPPLDDVFLATERTIVPKHGVIGTTTTSPGDVGQLNKMLAMGWGDFDFGPGIPVVASNIDGTPPPASGPNPTLISRFVHLTDVQLADDESPSRLAGLDTIGATNGAFRPQEGSECRILNAAVRTINALNKKKALDFVLLGGDNADNSQDNELQWFLSIMGGSPKVECDSGIDNDPTHGANNDGKDPFFAEGLDMRWYWVTGNHDVLKQGNLPAVQFKAEALGTKACCGTRDWSQPGGPITSFGQTVPADPRRIEHTRQDMLQRVHQDGDGHGITAGMIDYGKAYYTFDAPSGNLRFLVVDSAAETGGADGVIHQKDVDMFVKPFLDKAQADGKLVIVTSHHVSVTLSNGGDLGGTTQKDALTPQQWVDLLGSYPNVIMHLAGHTHLHRVSKGVPDDGGHPFWQLESAALADFPNQMRMIEIWDQDDGFISIKGIPLDYSTDGDPVAADGRKRGIVDRTSSWGWDGSG